MPLSSNFFTTLNYSSVNEDWRTEAAGLRIGTADSVLCVTGSGDRPLDLLTLDPSAVVSVDLNPAQNHLLQLKIAALDLLPYDEYAAFLGLHRVPRRQRHAIWDRIAPTLPPISRAFWLNRGRIIERGVLYAGRWERFYARASRLARLVRPRMLARLFEFADVDEQRAYLERHWNSPAWRASFYVLASPLTARLFFGDPAFYNHGYVNAPQVLFRRMRASLDRYPARDNFMISLVLRGRLSETDLPPYLTPAGQSAIRSRLDRLRVVTSDIVEFLTRNRPGTFTRLSLSDVPSYMDAHDFERLVDVVKNATSPGARLVIRQFLTRYPFPERCRAFFARDEQLEKRLAEEDRAFAYEFFVAERTEDRAA